jgi:hypothetical protein
MHLGLESDSLLRPLFVSDGLLGESGSGAAAFMTVHDRGGDQPLSSRCRHIVSRMRAGVYVAVIIDLAAGSRWRRIIDLLRLSRRIAAAEKVLAGCKAAVIASFGVMPDLHTPTIVYPLNSPAAAYVRRNLVIGGGSFPMRLCRALLSCWTKYGSDLGAVVIVGRKL